MLQEHEWGASGAGAHHREDGEPGLYQVRDGGHQQTAGRRTPSAGGGAIIVF